MNGKWIILWRLILICIPMLAMVLWLASGREVLTKTGKYVEVEIVDEVFRDKTTEYQLVRGPILGCYIGLDLVLGSTAGSLAVGGVSWFVRHRRKKLVTA